MMEAGSDLLNLIKAILIDLPTLHEMIDNLLWVVKILRYGKTRALKHGGRV